VAGKSNSFLPSLSTRLIEIVEPSTGNRKKKNAEWNSENAEE
jgi:hypothetical protein